VDALNSTPSVSTLEGYQAIMVVGNSGFFNSVQLGNNIAQYITDGRSLVVTANSNLYAACPSSNQLCGAFQDQDDWALEPGLQVSNSHAILGTILVPNDPIFANVGTGAAAFDGGAQSYRVNASKNALATTVATWNDGITPFAVRRTFSSGAVEIALNFYPVSDSAPGAAGQAWLHTTQGGLIMANAFNEAAGVPEPATYLMMATGLGLIAMLLRRRRGTLQCESEQRSRRR
jgi:hypothetical protein